MRLTEVSVTMGEGQMMSKGQEAKKSTKKEPAKTPKEKKADKKVKKAEKLRLQ